MGMLDEFKQYNKHLREFAMYKRLEGENISHNHDDNDNGVLPDNNRQTTRTTEDSVKNTSPQQWTVRVQTSITCTVVAIVILVIIAIFIMIFLITNRR